MNEYTKRYLAQFDELNNLLATELPLPFTDPLEVGGGSSPSAVNKERILEALEDIMVTAYVEGIQSTRAQLAKSLGDDTLDYLEDTDVNAADLHKIIDKSRDGVTFADRAKQHLDNENYGWLKTASETELHRVYNEASDSVAQKAASKGAEVYKTWLTMEDDRVRDTHFWLDGVTVRANDAFYTVDGDSAMYPGDFTDDRNNNGCRCWLEYSAVPKKTD